MLPQVDHEEATAWDRKLLASQLTQGVMLGEGIPKLARRVQRVTGSSMSSAVRTARTAVTGAENAGRVASYKRAQEMGIKLGQEWVATIDGRTRHSHRQLDGEVVEVGEKFSNGCRYPGDPQGKPWEVYNCRCTLVAAVDGVDTSDADRWSKLPPGMTYEEWKQGGARKARSKDAPTECQQAADDAAKSIQASLSAGQELSANAVRRIVGKVVPLGPEAGKTASDYIDTRGTGKWTTGIVGKGVAYVPTSMLKTIGNSGVKVKRDFKARRSGFYPGENVIVLASDADELTVVHELMHVVEEHDKTFLAAEDEYFKQRTSSRELRLLSDLTGNPRYDKNEWAYDLGEKCIDPYAFKSYRGRGFELMSMGVEMLYRNPKSYIRDPEMVKWVVSMLGRF